MNYKNINLKLKLVCTDRNFHLLSSFIDIVKLSFFYIKDFLKNDSVICPP